MLKKNSLFKKISGIWKRIHLVDKCLFIFMTALLIQVTFGLFYIVGNTNETNGIDVIIRTSAAAIFGYFLSGNFAREKKQDTASTAKDASINASDASDTPSEIATKPEADNKPSYPQSNQLQVIIATAVGMFCLIVLTVIRNSMGSLAATHTSSDTTATVSMFRDFVSGCVGFLLGSPTENVEK